MFGANDGAFTHIRAFPDAFFAGNDVLTLLIAFISGIEVVAVAQGNCGRTDEIVFEAINRAGRVTEHAVDALAELLVIFELIRRLEIFSFGYGFFFFSNNPGFDRFEFVHKVGHVGDEIAHNGEVDQGFHAHFVGIIVAQHRGTGEFGFAIDHHAATAAHAHSARPAE